MPGRSAARLRYGRATPPINVSAPAALADASNRRRDKVAPLRSIPGMKPPPRRFARAMPESFDSRSTLARRFDDDVTRQKETANFGKLAVRRGLILRLGGPQKY
jgi:hypothetical protein